MFHLSLYPIGDSLLLVGSAALVLVLLLGLGPPRGKTTRGKRAVLTGLRLGIIVLVILAMLRPTLVYTRTEKQAATLAVLADQSWSMDVPDEAAGRTRWEALRRTLADAKSAFRALDEDFEIKAYTFDAQAHPAELNEGQILLPELPRGRQTAIGSVLEDVLRQEAGKRLLGVVLLSDGAQRAYPPRDVLPQTAAARLKHLDFPLFTFRFGKSRGLGQAQDVAVKDLLANPNVYVKNELSVSGQIRADGYVNREIPVQLLVETSPGKMEVVHQKTLTAKADGELIPVEFTYVPQLPGEFKISLEAVQQPGELVGTNNRLSTFVNVLKGGLNVLYLEGTLRKEMGAIHSALDASPDINCDFIPPSRLDPRRPESRVANLPERFKPGKYEVYILGDLDSSVFKGTELANLADAVSKGAGLIMIGGFHSFGPGGYAETPLKDVLPVKMDRLERQALDGALSKDLHLLGPLKMTPTEINPTHFILMLAANRQQSQAVWSQLPPLDGANRFAPTAVKRGALVLATDDGDRPLLICHTYQAGRVMAFAGDSTWRWPLQGHDEAHKRFWRQVVLWLARKDEAMEGNVWVRLDQRQFGLGQRVEFTAGAQSATGTPVEDAQFDARVELPDGTERFVPLAHSGGKMTGSFRDTLAPGDYAVRVTATENGQVLGSAQSRFLVFEQNLELDNPAADATVLDNLAAMTGGRSLLPEELSNLIRELTEDTESLEIQTETKKPLWDTWGFLLLLVGLLGTEWYLRKRWGLV